MAFKVGDKVAVITEGPDCAHYFNVGQIGEVIKVYTPELYEVACPRLWAADGSTMDQVVGLTDIELID